MTEREQKLCLAICEMSGAIGLLQGIAGGLKRTPGLLPHQVEAIESAIKRGHEAQAKSQETMKELSK